MNLRLIQNVSPVVPSKSTQTNLGFGNNMASQKEDEHKEKVDRETQHDIENHNNQLLTEEATLETESDTTSEDLDSSHVSTQSESKLFENKDDAANYCNSRIKTPSGVMLYWSSLLLLL